MNQVLAFLLLIGPLIFIHELGHLLAAKLVGVKALSFSIGFGPALLKIRLGETEYRLAPIPLGGYVTLLGATPTDDVPAHEESRALRSKPLWARYLVLFAGPLFNLLLPVLLYGAFFLGQTQVDPPVIGTILDQSAAQEFGLEPGDRVLAVNGDDLHSWRDLQDHVRRAPGQELHFEIERGGERIDRYISPRRTLIKTTLGETIPRGQLGVFPWSYAPQIGLSELDCPAYEKGLRTGDIITSINGEPIETIEQLVRELASNEDASIRLTYLRARETEGELASYLWYESKHTRLLPRKDAPAITGIGPANTFVRTVAEDSPAFAAGLRPGDRVLAIDDLEITRWETLALALDRKGEEPAQLRVQTPGEAPRTIALRQETRSFRDVYRQDRDYLWFGADPYQSRQLPEPEPIRGRFTYAARSAVVETLTMLEMMWTSLRQMVMLERGVDELTSVVGIFNVAGTAAQRGPGEFLLLMALISINLGFVNLLPIPILDGGHLMFFTIEAIRRRPLGQRARELASAIGLVIILLLLLIALRNDVIRFWLDP